MKSVSLATIGTSQSASAASGEAGAVSATSFAP